MDFKKIKFRAHSVGALMVGGNSITEKQLEEIAKFEERKEQHSEGVKGVRPLTEKMEERLAELIAKRDAPFELSQTAKSYIKKEWLRIEYGYKEPIVTDVLLKGQMCEEDTIALVSEIYEVGEFRMKNEKNFENEFFTGTPDLVFDKVDLVEDLKAPWSLKTFSDKKDVEPIYYCQLQVYMNLTGKTNATVHYCLVDTPEELVHREQKRFFWKFGGDEENPGFVEAAELIEKNHKVGEMNPRDRVKSFCFEYDPAYIEELEKRVMAAWDYYNTLKLVEDGISDEADLFFSRFTKPF